MLENNVNKKRASFEDFDPNFSTGENFGELYKNFTDQKEVKEGSITKGAVIAIEKDTVVVDIGTKNEGYIPIKEFQNYNEHPQVGDIFDVYVEKIESRNGNTVISRDKALKEEHWKVLDQVLKDNKTVEGIIFHKVKGGFTVDINGIIAFLPGSQVDVRPVKDMTPLMGIKQEFKILKIDRKQGNIVVSRRAILEETRDEAKEEILANLKEGQVHKGVVKNITEYGAFVDLGRVDGLLHVTDISWGRINHPSEILTLGQEIKVQIIKFNQETKRISLGMKQLEANPWENIAQRYPKGQQFTGKVSNIADYGVFITLEPGIEGLVHVSEISWGKTNVHPRNLVSLNQEVKFVILDIDANKHRISLGMKQCNDNPWSSFADKYPVDSEVEGFVKNIVDFGIFVGFENDIDGLVHVSDIAWDEKDCIAKLKTFEKDQKVKVKVLATDVEKERISLGIKQLDEAGAAAAAAADNAISELKKGDVVTCMVQNISNAGLEVIVNDNLSGFIKVSELSLEKSEQKTNRFAVDEKIDAKIIAIERASGQLSLSIRALEKENKRKAIEEYGSVDSGASLGDILGDALSQVDPSIQSDKK